MNAMFCSNILCTAISFFSSRFSQLYNELRFQNIDVSTVLPTDKNYALDLFTNVLQIPTPKCIQINLQFTAILHILKFLEQL